MEPLEILDDAVKRHNPRYVIGMFSGGHDSLVATHIASQHPRFSFALHINTGIGIEMTREFVRRTCKEWGIELREYKAAENKRANGRPDPQIYADIVERYGFPGKAQHTTMYIRLKQRPLEMAMRELPRKRFERVLLVTGVRSQESIRRMAHVKPEQKWGSKYWIAPIWRFSKLDVGQYILDHGLKRNLVVDLIHMSGECLCGAYAHRGELEELRQWFPETAAEIDAIEQRVFAAGFTWGWEDDITRGSEKKKAEKPISGKGCIPMLCATCETNR